MALLLSRSGIAAAAHVRRPVVSIWQRRPIARGVSAPFPAPVPGQTDLFDLDEVIAWQRRTGRGNNEAFAEDVPLYAVTARGAVVDQVTALIALASRSGIDLLESTPAELVAAAADADPFDRFLLTEVRACAAEPELRALAQRQVEAAFGASAAIEAVVAARARTGSQRAWRLTDPTVAAIDAIASALAPGGLATSDGGIAVAGDLALRVALADPEGATPWLGSAGASGAPADSEDRRRLSRRRAWAAGIADVAGQASTVALVQLPRPNAPELAPVEVLRAIDELVLGLAPGAVALVVGPAAVLCDAPADRESLLGRADVLRSGRLRGAIRLPAGLVVDKPRSELGLWLLGDADPEAEVGDRLVIAGDVSRLGLTAAVVDGVASDLAASLGGVAQIRLRAFAHARPVKTARVLAQDGALVARTTPSAGRSGSESTIAALATLDRLHRQGLCDDVELAVARDPEPGRVLALGSWCAAGDARVIRGRRVNAEPPEGATVPVLGSGQVLGAPVRDRVSALLAHGVHSRAVTEPGDVVFVAAPRPAAIVDDGGGSLVAAPARILRLRQGSPHAVAAAIARQQPGAGVQEWLLPVPPEGAAGPLEAALTRMQRERAALMRQLAELEELENHLVDGVTSGALVVETDMMQGTNEGDEGGTNRAG